MAIGTLSIDIEARLAKFEQNMDRAARIAEKNADQTRAAWSRVGKQFAEIGGAAAGLFAGYSAVEFLRGNIDAIDSLNDMQDATGASIEKLSGLVDVAARTGHTVDDATSLIVKLNAALNDTDKNSTASRAIKAIGLDADELRRQDPVDAIQSVAKALGNFADDGAKARLVQELFGKSARELSPLLKDLADTGTLNAKVTAEQAAQADKFNKALAEMQTNSANVARSFVADLLPALNRFFDELKAGREAFGGTFSAIFKLGTEMPGPALENLQRRREELAAVRKEMAGLEADGKNGDRSGIVGRFLGDLNDGRLAELKSRSEELQKYINHYEKVLKITDGKAGGGRGFVNPDSELPSIGQLPDKQKDKPVKLKAEKDEMADSPPIPEARRNALDAIKESDLVKAQELRDTLRDLLRLRDTPGVETDGIDQAIAKVSDELSKLSPEARKAADEQKRLKELIAATDTEQLEKARADMELLAQAFLDGKITAEQFNEAASKRLNLEPVKDEVSEFTKQAARNIQDELGSTTERVLKGNFDGILKSWGDLILKMIAQAAAAKLGKALFGDFDKTGEVGGIAGGWWDEIGKSIGTFFGGFADGGAFGPGGQITAFAKGDLFSSPTAFGFGGGQMGVMGEAGPEAVMPLKRGADGRLGVAASGGGSGRTVVQVFNQGAPVSASASSERQPDGSQLIKVMLNAVSDNVASGGVVARAMQSRFPQLKG